MGPAGTHLTTGDPWANLARFPETQLKSPPLTKQAAY
jgi:hypothetical protein